MVILQADAFREQCRYTGTATHRSVIIAELSRPQWIVKQPNGLRISRRRRRAAHDDFKKQRSCAPKAVGCMRGLGRPIQLRNHLSYYFGTPSVVRTACNFA